MPNKDIDRREEILLSEFNKYKDPHPGENWASWDSILSDGTAQITFNAMDENGKRMCLELLEYMANNHVKCGFTGDGSYFNFKGECITKEQLFENFL